MRSSDTAQEEIANIRGILGDLVERIDYLEEQLVDVNDKSSASYTPMHTSEEIEAVGSLEKKLDQPATDSHTQKGSIFSRYFGKYNQGDWENIIGRNWFAILGVAALAIGIAFFLLLAFENNWVNDLGRVGIGIGVGALLIMLGDYVRNRYVIWSRAVVGGGLAILFITLYVAFESYGIIPYLGALVLLSGVSIMGAFLALRHNSRLTAILSIVIAFINPALLDFSEFQKLIPYIAIINLSVLLLAFTRNWRILTSFALAGSYFYMFSIVASIYDGELQFLLSEIITLQSGFTIIFLIFIGATTVFHLYSKATPEYSDLSLMIINPLAYYVLSFAFLDGQNLGNIYIEYIGWIMGGIYLIISYISYRALMVSPRIPLFSAGIAVLFFTVSIAVQFGGEWLSVAWGAEGLLLIVSGLLLKQWRARSLGLVLILIAGLRLLEIPSLDIINASQKFLPLQNDLFVASIMLVIISYVASYALYLNRNFQLEEDIWLKKRDIWPTRWWLTILATVLTIWSFSREILTYFRNISLSGDQMFLGQPPDIAGELVVTIFLAIYAALVFVIGARLKSLIFRNIFIAVGGVAVAKLLLFDASSFTVIPYEFVAIFNLYFAIKFIVAVLLLLVIMSTKWWYSTNTDYLMQKALWIVFNVLVIFSLTTELINFFESRVYVSSLDTMSAMHLSLTLLWALHAVVLLIYGFLSKDRVVRIAGLGLLAIPIGKLFIFDVFLLESGYRVVAFVVLGITMLSIGFGYQKYNRLFKGLFWGSN
ncbi:MAG: DUF2339 domain-containing protein [Dehalococcoidia bacterium]